MTGCRRGWGERSVRVGGSGWGPETVTGWLPGGAGADPGMAAGVVAGGPESPPGCLPGPGVAPGVPAGRSRSRSRGAAATPEPLGVAAAGPGVGPLVPAGGFRSRSRGAWPVGPGAAPGVAPGGCRWGGAGLLGGGGRAPGGTRSRPGWLPVARGGCPWLWAAAGRLRRGCWAARGRGRAIGPGGPWWARSWARVGPAVSPAWTCTGPRLDRRAQVDLQLLGVPADGSGRPPVDPSRPLSDARSGSGPRWDRSWARVRTCGGPRLERR